MRADISVGMDTGREKRREERTTAIPLRLHSDLCHLLARYTCSVCDVDTFLNVHIHYSVVVFASRRRRRRLARLFFINVKREIINVRCNQ